MEELSPVGSHRNALEALWQKYRSKWRRLLSKNAVRELQLRASFDVDLLTHWRFSNHVPAGQIPDCPNCTNICCAGLENVVSLRLRDVAQLMDIDRTDLISRKKPNFPSTMLAERPNLRELVASELWRSLPVLRQVGELRVCAALGRNMTCSLHPNWPTSCERFPYTLSVMRRTVSWGSRCPSRKLSPEFEPRRRELFKAALNAYNERVKDAILLAHAREALDEIGIGDWLTRPGDNPFEEVPRGLSVIQ